MYDSQTPTTKHDEVRTLLPHPDPLVNTTSLEDEQERSQNVEEPTLAGKIGYSYQKESNAYQSLQKSFRIPDELIKLHDPIARDSKQPSKDPSLTSRYRNLVALLPPAAISKSLIDTYFKEVSWYTSTLDRYYFEADYRSWIKAYDATCVTGLSRDLQFFPALLFQVLAVAVQFLDPEILATRLLNVQDPTSRERLSHRYSTAGVEIMSVLKRHNPTLSSIQHDQIRSLWLKCCSRGTESWYALTDAIRQGQDLGLHIQSEVPQGQDVGETLSRLWFDEHKRRIWVALFIADSHMSIILGRPRAINTSDCTARTPFDCDIPDDPSNTIPGTTNPMSPPSHYSLSLFNYHIGYLFHEMLSLGASKKHTKNYNSVKVLHDKVIVLLDDLPPAVRPRNPDTSWDSRDPDITRQRQQIATIANAFLMSLHREHVQVHPESRIAAIRAGIEVLASQERMFPLLQRHHYRMYGLSCFTIDACMFLSAAALDKDTIVGVDHAILQELTSALRRAIDQLKAMADMSPMAKSGAELLEHCFPQIQDRVTNICGGLSDHDSSTTLSVEYQDYASTGEQPPQAWPDLNGIGHVSVDQNPTSLDDFGGDRFRPDMFEEFVTLDMGQDDYPTFDFDLMETDASHFDFNTIYPMNELHLSHVPETQTIATGTLPSAH